MPNEEIKLYVPEQIARELEEAARENPGYTRNEVAVDVLRQCTMIWRVARRAFRGSIEDYLRLVSEQARQVLEQQKK